MFKPAVCRHVHPARNRASFPLVTRLNLTWLVQALLKANGSAPVVDLGPASTAPSASRARLPGKTALSRRLGDSPADNAGQMYAVSELADVLMCWQNGGCGKEL